MEQDHFSVFVSVHILFLKDERILLSLRKNISSDGLYGLVAGHLDKGETVTSAIIREAREEVDVVIEPEDIKIATVCHSYNQKNGKEFIQFYVICNKWQGEFKNNEPEKCGELKFFPLKNLPENIVPYIKDAIDKTINGVKYYEYGWHGES
ncbi:MAG: NUDIX domain-containing protein [Candidatus Komeilibacteria bacterium]|nr:NUDIX domain-containing protein [Candidatus Komeilibacteria bacterium]